MRKHAETSGGLIRKVPYCEVTVTVQFGPQERGAIQKYGLEDVTVLDRAPPANVRNAPDPEDLYNLKIQHLVRGSDSYLCATPVRAKAYDYDLRNSLEKLKAFLDANATPLTGQEVYEL